jgi:hypothetical protein
MELTVSVGDVKVSLMCSGKRSDLRTGRTRNRGRGQNMQGILGNEVHRG